jgi:hypothetical protein
MRVASAAALPHLFFCHAGGRRRHWGETNGASPVMITAELRACYVNKRGYYFHLRAADALLVVSVSSIWLHAATNHALETNFRLSQVFAFILFCGNINLLICSPARLYQIHQLIALSHNASFTEFKPWSHTK